MPTCDQLSVSGSSTKSSLEARATVPPLLFHGMMLVPHRFSSNTVNSILPAPVSVELHKVPVVLVWITGISH